LVSAIKVAISQVRNYQQYFPAHICHYFFTVLALRAIFNFSWQFKNETEQKCRQADIHLPIGNFLAMMDRD